MEVWFDAFPPIQKRHFYTEATPNSISHSSRLRHHVYHPYYARTHAPSKLPLLMGISRICWHTCTPGTFLKRVGHQIPKTQNAPISFAISNVLTKGVANPPNSPYILYVHQSPTFSGCNSTIRGQTSYNTFCYHTLIKPLVMHLPSWGIYLIEPDNY